MNTISKLETLQAPFVPSIVLVHRTSLNAPGRH